MSGSPSAIRLERSGLEMKRLVGPDLFWSIGRLDGVVTAVVAVEPASAHSTVLRKDAAMGQVGHACMASAETSRSSFSVAPLAD